MSDADPAAAKRVLSRLVTDDPLVRGEQALNSLPAAAQFLDDGGPAELRAIVSGDTDERAARARRVLAAFRAVRVAARGGRPDQFRPGRNTHLGHGSQPPPDDSGDPHR